MSDSAIRQAPSLQTIRSRKNELLSTAAKYEALAAKARAEAADFEAAERVWLKMMPDAALETADGVLVVEAKAGTGKSRFLESPRKPIGTPSVPDMIIEALSFIGRPATPNELLVYVRQKYWPEAGTSDVGSTAWRMSKEGRLTRPEDGHYGLPNGNGSHPDLLVAGQDTRSGVV